MKGYPQGIVGVEVFELEDVELLEGLKEEDGEEELKEEDGRGAVELVVCEDGLVEEGH